MKRETAVFFIVTFLFGLAAHALRITNVLSNDDNVLCTPDGYGSSFTSGRWALGWLGEFFTDTWGQFNLPAFNTLLTLVVLCAAAYVIVRLYEIQSLALSAAVGMVFISFPTITATLFFTFTSVYYAFAVLLAVLSVYLTKKYKFGFFAGIVCLAVSIGIYQAYLPLAIALSLMLVIQEAFTPGADLKKSFLHGVKYVAVIVAGLAVYMVMLKAALAIENLELSTYQGVNEMGNLDLKMLPGLLLDTYKKFALLLVKDVWGISATKVMRLCILLADLISIATGGYLLIAYRRKWYFYVFGAALALMFPIAVNSIIIMCPTSDIGTLMAYALVCIFILPVVLLNIAFKQEKIPWKKGMNLLYNLAFCVLLLTSLNQAWTANGNYTQMYYNNQQTISYFDTLVTRIRSADNYRDENPVYFAGDRITDLQFANSWAPYNEFFFTGAHKTDINSYARTSWLENYLGFVYKEPTAEQIEQILADERFQEMPCYPDDGSVRVLDGVTVVKFEDMPASDS